MRAAASPSGTMVHGTGEIHGTEITELRRDQHVVRAELRSRRPATFCSVRMAIIWPVTPTQ
jgi:hypothetical protein